jgi:signal transduction histidine kinase
MTAGGSFLIPTLFLHFVITLLERPQSAWILRTAYACSALFALLSFTPLMVQSPAPKLYLNNFFSPGPLYLAGVVFFVSAISLGHYWLYRKFASSTGQTKNQYAYLFWSSAAGYIGGAANFLLVFSIDVPLLNPWGTYAVPLYVAATSYAIIRHRLMDITVVIHKGLAYGLLLAAVLIPVSLTIVISERVTPHSIPPLLAGAFILGCGFWVFLKRTQAVTHVTFSLICLAMSIWLFGFFMAYSSDSRAEASLWGKCVHVGVVYLPALFYHFSASLLRNRFGHRLIASNYFISTIFLLLIPTPYLIDGDYSYFWGYYPKAGLLHPLFLTYFGSICGLGLFRIFQGYEAALSAGFADAAQLKMVFWAFVIGYAASADFAQSYGLAWYPFGGLLAGACVTLAGYALTRYEAEDSALLPAQPQVVSYLKALGLVPFYLAVLLLIKLFTGATHYLLAGVLLATFMAFAGVLAGIQKRMEKGIERVLFRRRYDAYETLTEFSKAMVSILDLNALHSTIMATLSHVLEIEHMTVFLLDKDKAQYALAASHGRDAEKLASVRLPASEQLPYYLNKTRTIVVTDELARHPDAPNLSPVLDTLRLLQAEVCLPLINKDRLVGFFNLGPRAHRNLYSDPEIHLLTTLAQNAAVALDNAMLYEDLRRSQMLMRRTDRLRSLETIAGGFAHEIRNPLTSIKTFVQLAPERKHDEEFVGQFNQVVMDDVYRIERLIQEILDYSRYMEPKFAEEDLNEIVASCLYFVDVKAESKNIRIEKALPRHLPSVMLDRQQLKQVLLNLLLNAMEAMGDLGGVLSVKTRRLARPGDGWVQIEVRDSGPGIPPGDLEHIFDPFYTTKHQSGEREGTGLGLTIVHQIVQEHHGYIEVESQPGRGTTFLINLPVTQLQTTATRESSAHEKARSAG